MQATTPHYGADGMIGDQQIAFHVQKALGGVALSRTGATSTYSSGGMRKPLEALSLAVIAIGECVAPRDIENATFEGRRAAGSI